MKKLVDCSEWTTSELFEYAIGASLIHPEEEFENWMNDRTDLYRIVQDDLDSQTN